MRQNIFSTLQALGKTFMLPIALLPLAGLLLGVGASFTNQSFISLYNLEGLLGSETIVFRILMILKSCGMVVFANLPLLFACAVALGFAKKAKEVAVLSAVVAYFMFNATMAATLENFNLIDQYSRVTGLLTSTLGFQQTLNTGVFGGIIVGALVAWIHNKTVNIVLPDALSFFAGVRFVPIASSFMAVILGVLFVIVWPSIGYGIAALGIAIAKMGIFGTFIYGFIYRALIPIGLHHVFYLPFWQTALGGQALVNGTVVSGAQNIVFAQLAAGQIVNPEYARFFSGLFPFMIFGLPAAGLAMVHTAREENRERVKGLMMSASLTSLFTGITEPIEFAFLFASPVLYFGIHCILGALSFALMHLFHVGVGLTFSGGLIDFMLYGVLPGNRLTHYTPILIAGVLYAFIYYIVFKFFIIKFDLKTPGREAKQLQTREESWVVLALEGLGGKNNIITLDNCATRLRVQVKSIEHINEETLKQSGSIGVVKSGQSVQIIYGTKVSQLKLELDDLLGQQ